MSSWHLSPMPARVILEHATGQIFVVMSPMAAWVIMEHTTGQIFRVHIVMWFNIRNEYSI